MAQARKILHAAIAIACVACAASAQDQSRTIAAALCVQYASCGQNVSNMNACVDTLSAQLAIVCSDDDARACSAALEECGAAVSTSKACEPCH